MYRLLLIIQDQSGFRVEVLQRLCQRLQCLDSVRLLAAHIYQSEYSAYLTSVWLRDTRGSCTHTTSSAVYSHSLHKHGHYRSSSIFVFTLRPIFYVPFWPIAAYSKFAHEHIAGI